MTTTALNTPQEAARWLRARVTGRLHTDSRQVREGDGFLAWPVAGEIGKKIAGIFFLFMRFVLCKCRYTYH